MIDTTQFRNMSPEERATYGKQIREKLGLPPDAGDWEVIGTLTVLAARLMDAAGRSFAESPPAIANLLEKLSKTEKGVLIDLHKRVRGLSKICKFMGWEPEE